MTAIRRPLRLHGYLHASPSIAQTQPYRRCFSTAVKPVAEGTPLTSVLIANRGEIAIRVARTALKSGIRATTVYTDPDATAQHALCSPFAINIGQPNAYLDGDRIIEVAKKEGCQSIHPGYGFLSENPTFARRVSEAGLIFIGPPWKAIQAMGRKSESKNIMNAAGVPCIPGYHGGNQDPDFLQARAEEIGYPVLLKAVRGGGGKGMRIAQTAADFHNQLESARSESMNSFGDDVMLVEKYIMTPRHIEVQIFADKYGNCVALGERDCSIQRRHQKILEESPAPHLSAEIRDDLWSKARAAAVAVGYEGAGTVEFIFDKDTGQFFFMEMNTRLQVEHPVTEMVTGEDLVHWQFLVAAGGPLPLNQDQIKQRIAKRGWAVEARIYAENPDMNFIPDAGRLQHLKRPETSESVRIDAGFIQGDEISSHYDPMIAKLIVGACTRDEAIRKLKVALDDYEVVGVATNIEFLKKVCEHASFMAGDVETGFIDKHRKQLFERQIPEAEVYAQAALGTLTGFGSSAQRRSFSLVEPVVAGREIDSVEIPVTIEQIGRHRFDIVVQNHRYLNVTSTLDCTTNTITTFYPRMRVTTTLVRSDDVSLSLFQRGKHYRLQLVRPAWHSKALCISTVTNSVVAPMPCKVVRVDVKEGDTVTKDQALVVIESMKMETVIRSPLDGIIKKVVHSPGDMCKAGTALVEFVEDETISAN